MGYKNFELIDFEFVKVRFLCSKCNTRLVSDLIKVPDLDNLEVEDDGFVIYLNTDNKECPKCAEYYFIHVGFNDDEKGYVEVDGLDANNILNVNGFEYGLYNYEENYVDSLLHSVNSFERFTEEIHNLSELNSLSFTKNEHSKTISKLIFSGAIACLEDYLSSTLVKAVIQDEIFFKNFVKTYKNIKNRKFELGNIYNHLDNLYDVVKKELLDVIYHDLPKVKGMYNDTLNIKFSSIEFLMKNIQTRHDIVHRNGKTKDGIVITLEKSDIDTHLEEINKFVKHIQNQVDVMYDDGRYYA